MKKAIPTIIPRGKNVLVKQDETKSTNTAGIITPDSVEVEAKAIGTVISVGNEVTDIKKGDRVIFGVYAGEDLMFTNDKVPDYKLLLEEDILAFVKEK